MILKKILLIFFTLFYSVFCAFSFPGFSSLIPDVSGEYVFYKDNTFTRESYIGILFYDEQTLQVRYFAPKDLEKSLPQINIAFLVSIDFSDGHLELTGEKIIAGVLTEPQEIEIINYLHDILYDFSNKRINAGKITGQNKLIYQEYEQFGGRVSMNYDATIPIFNLRKIESIEGKSLFECCVIGRLQNNNDKSFNEFSGFFQPQKNQTKTKKSLKKAKNKIATFENQSINLDENWEQKMENFWALNSDSMITMTFLPLNNEFKNQNQQECFILRKFLYSSYDSYKNLTETFISKNDNKIIIKSNVYKSLVGNAIFVTNILTKKSNGYDYYSQSTYKNVYDSNEKYFEQITKSYKN